ARHRGDLFDSPDDVLDPTDPAQVLDPRGYLRPGFVAATQGAAVGWATLAVQAADAQADQLRSRPRALATAYSESGAGVLALELELEGLPVHRATLEELIAASAGPRPNNPREEAAARALRDQGVLRCVPPGRTVDLRNPEQLLELLRSLGIRVESTRKWELENHRSTHPVVEAVLRWRANERIATTYGWTWLEHHVGSDDRLRGRWHSFDGGAGRMTAEAGLHNLPGVLRPAVVAEPGHVFVRADLGQIEPRVLAVVSGDSSLITATEQPDLYSSVATQLGVDRPIAKVAMLSAMYGGAAGQAAAALEGLDRSYPRAMAYLRSAQAAGENGRPVTTYGGRLIRIPPSVDQAQARARGRFARNAVVQGAAAELFKAWALTTRHSTAVFDARIVLCLHDELLVHVREEHAAEAAAAVDQALQDAARRWSQGSAVQFVSDTAVIRCWADAKP
ncbi:MAG: DNA polymerase, partial [Allobranchiibius sp.]